jgi:hypothetical protein
MRHFYILKEKKFPLNHNHIHNYKLTIKFEINNFNK